MVRRSPGDATNFVVGASSMTVPFGFVRIWIMRIQSVPIGGIKMASAFLYYTSSV